MNPLLEVENLQVSFAVRDGEVQAVRGVSFKINRGETVAIVGESGCGKSVTAQSLMRLIPMPPGRIKSGRIRFNEKELLDLSEREMEDVRGSEIGMIFQDPMTSLNPVMTIGSQIAEGLMKHRRLRRHEAVERALELLKLVGIPHPAARLRQYPHEFSGGMRQRVMIAIAIACDPMLLIADEPTTALDVTIQAQILQLLKDLQKQSEMAIILITHDLGVVADLCDRVVVMYAGKVVEAGSKREIFKNPQHPYTRGLLRSVPRLDQPKDRPLVPIVGTPPDLLHPPAGCGFCARCTQAMNVCLTRDAELFAISKTHSAKCWLHHPLAKETTISS